MNVIKFELGKDYTMELYDTNATATCVEIKESLYSGKEVVFEIGSKYYRCDVCDAYDPTTSLYSEQADFGDNITTFATWEEK